MMSSATLYKVRIILALLGAFALFQGTFSFSSYISFKQNQHYYLQDIEKRVALDLPWLQLANIQMKQVANKHAIRQYMDKINQRAINLHLPVRLQSLQGIDSAISTKTATLVNRQLNAPDRALSMVLMLPSFTLVNSLSIYPLLASLIMVYLARGRLKTWGKTPAIAEQPDAPKPKLIINLHERTLCNSMDGSTVQLSNKPFCFYIALLDYCLKYDNAALNHNKNLPPELLELANRYFYRLIELGHTIRKRPDFSSNLDKMLSEIRAALEDVYKHCPDLKAPYYPPKAQGEGSRSKLHNYALEMLSEDELEFIGK